MKSLLIFAILASCATPQTAQVIEAKASEPVPEYRASVIAREWIRIIPRRSQFPAGSFMIDGSRVKSVDPSMVPIAVRLLGRESSRILSSEQLIELGTAPFANQADGIPVLVRGVGMKVGTGAKDSGISADRVRVYFRDGVAVVSRYGFRKDVFDFEPAPVVALLPRVPTDVYVEPAYGISEGAESAEN